MNEIDFKLTDNCIPSQLSPRQCHHQETLNRSLVFTSSINSFGELMNDSFVKCPSPTPHALRTFQVLSCLKGKLVNNYQTKTGVTKRIFAKDKSNEPQSQTIKKWVIRKEFAEDVCTEPQMGNVTSCRKIRTFSIPLQGYKGNSRDEQSNAVTRRRIPSACIRLHVKTTRRSEHLQSLVQPNILRNAFIVKKIHLEADQAKEKAYLKQTLQRRSAVIHLSERSCLNNRHLRKIIS